MCMQPDRPAPQALRVTCSAGSGPTRNGSSVQTLPGPSLWPRGSGPPSSGAFLRARGVSARAVCSRAWRRPRQAGQGCPARHPLGRLSLLYFPRDDLSEIAQCRWAERALQACARVTGALFWAQPTGSARGRGPRTGLPASPTRPPWLPVHSMKEAPGRSARHLGSRLRSMDQEAEATRAAAFWSLHAVRLGLRFFLDGACLLGAVQVPGDGWLGFLCPRSRGNAGRRGFGAFRRRLARGLSLLV